MSKFKVGDVVVAIEQDGEGDTDFLYGQLGLVVDRTSLGNPFVMIADNDFDGYHDSYPFKEYELKKIGVL